MQVVNALRLNDGFGWYHRSLVTKQLVAKFYLPLSRTQPGVSFSLEYCKCKKKKKRSQSLYDFYLLPIYTKHQCSKGTKCIIHLIITHNIRNEWWSQICLEANKEWRQWLEAKEDSQKREEKKYQLPPPSHILTFFQGRDKIM